MVCRCLDAFLMGSTQGGQHAAVAVRAYPPTDGDCEGGVQTAIISGTGPAVTEPAKSLAQDFGDMTLGTKTEVPSEHTGDGASAVDETPKSFCCCITQSIMTDPVLDPEGFTYERSAIEEARQPLTVGQLVSNRSLQNAIEDFRGGALGGAKAKPALESAITVELVQVPCSTDDYEEDDYDEDDGWDDDPCNCVSPAMSFIRAQIKLHGKPVGRIGGIVVNRDMNLGQSGFHSLCGDHSPLMIAAGILSGRFAHNKTEVDYIRRLLHHGADKNATKTGMSALGMFRQKCRNDKDFTRNFGQPQNAAEIVGSRKV